MIVHVNIISSIDFALQMLQVPILGGMLKEGSQDRHLFHAAATLPISHTRYFRLRLSVHTIQKASCFLI